MLICNPYSSYVSLTPKLFTTVCFVEHRGATHEFISSELALEPIDIYLKILDGAAHQLFLDFCSNISSDNW